MKASKKSVKDAILFIANTVGKESQYKAIIELGATLPKVIEMITYEMFLRKFNFVHCSENEYEAYCIIHEYATELREKGWVIH
jgi:hypothetical protein